MTATIIVVSILAYLVIGGAFGSLFLNRARKNCPAWKGEQSKRARDVHVYSYERCDVFWDHGWTILAGIAWPLAIPLLIGVLIGSWLSSSEDRAERREKRLQADHERKMAELEAQREMTMESVKFLVENGIKADVPGLFPAGGES